MNQIIPVMYLRAGSPEPDVTLVGDGWESIGTGTYVYRTYFDLSGYNMQDLTAFFQAVEIQEGTFNSTNMSEMDIVDLVTIESMTDAACIQAAAHAFTAGDAPGFPLSIYDLDQVVYGRRRTYARTTAPGTLTPLYNIANYGTSEAASSDKLYVTRIVSIPSTVAIDEFVNISPCAYVVAIIVAEEKEVPYFMRQSRSYEAQKRS